jgi:hypothetical protein
MKILLDLIIKIDFDYKMFLISTKTIKPSIGFIVHIILE